ncbi:hypothetical protein GXM_01110 [Nostoc sphaeroides CCNUC1]|uniref:Uncharacterized protein n=1 Tax=Nostoc sphaeroides CCNUC1 TaxID=2653204 RepID=A0A5P8VTE0_9NOSO|nr:hypothetical protein GXM_01110 [Nostoc sphaeroides CCNUC1]
MGLNISSGNGELTWKMSKLNEFCVGGKRFVARHRHFT